MQPVADKPPPELPALYVRDCPVGVIGKQQDNHVDSFLDGRGQLRGSVRETPVPADGYHRSIRIACLGAEGGRESEAERGEVRGIDVAVNLIDRVSYVAPVAQVGDIRYDYTVIPEDIVDAFDDGHLQRRC